MRFARYIIFVFLFAAVCTSYGGNKFIIINVNGGIGPATAAYIGNSVEFAEEENAEALIIKLDTPGGLLSATRDIVASFLESEVPTVVYVAPGGSQAGSAGVFITLAANIAAMAPGTNIGAAHPVGIAGESDSSSVMYDKVTNDACAFIRSIAQKRGRNQDWAEKAVRKSISATENEALEAGVIDIIAKNTDSLLQTLDGMIVETARGEVTISSANPEMINRDMNWKEKLLALLSDPNLAYVFMMLAVYGILFELQNPGAIFPGVLGVLAAILAAYSLQMLPISIAGLALIFLSIVLFLIEIKVTSYGMLTIGGVISLFLGSTMLIDSPLEFMSISMEIIITVVILTVLFFAVVAGLGLKAQSRKKASGSEAMIGESGIAVENIMKGMKGSVKVHGELWKAVAEENVSAKEEIEIISVNNFVLSVKPRS